MKRKTDAAKKDHKREWKDELGKQPETEADHTG